MAQPVLPDSLREKIAGLFEDGRSSVEIFDAVFDEATPYVDSHEQLTRCIAALKGKISPGKTLEQKACILRPIKFDVSRQQGIGNQLSTTMIEKDFENRCQDIILKNYEGFSGIEDANTAGGFHNPPFDFFALKDSKPYIIEAKSSLKEFHT